MRSAAILGMVLLLGSTVAAEQKKKGKQDKPKGAQVVKEGKIRVVRGLSGGEPQLTDKKGKRHLCVGPVHDELLRLSGHTVKAWGSVGDKKMMTPTFKVARYEITDSGGRRPMVGVLRKEAKKEYKLERKEGLLTVKTKNKGLNRQLAKRVGCKVWMVGELVGETLRPYKFGWIRCAPPKAIKPDKETSTGKETRK